MSEKKPTKAELAAKLKAATQKINHLETRVERMGVAIVECTTIMRAAQTSFTQALDYLFFEKPE